MDEATKPKLSGMKILLAAILAIVLLLGGILYYQSTQTQSTPQFDITVTLEKIVKTSDLSTSVFKYDGIVEIPNPKKSSDIDYYIYYSASVYAGIDFSQIQFKEDKEKKTITAILPEVQINDTVVDPNSLDFMFMNKKADNVSVTTTALTACETDIQRECTSESALLEVARLNTENVIRALAEPVIEQVYADYTLVIE